MQGHLSRRKSRDFTQMSIPLGETGVYVLSDVYSNFKDSCKHCCRAAEEECAQTIDSSTTSLKIIRCQRLN